MSDPCCGLLVWLHGLAPTLSPLGLRVALEIAARSAPTGSAEISTRKLAIAVGHDHRHVRRALADLAAIGAYTVNKGTPTKPSVYAPALAGGGGAQAPTPEAFRPPPEGAQAPTPEAFRPPPEGAQAPTSIEERARARPRAFESNIDISIRSIEEIAEMIVTAAPTAFSQEHHDYATEALIGYRRTHPKNGVAVPFARPDEKITAQVLAAANGPEGVKASLEAMHRRQMAAGDGWPWFISVIADLNGVPPTAIQRARGQRKPVKSETDKAREFRKATEEAS